MSNSRSNDTRADGVGLFADRVRRMFPPAFMKSRRNLGVKCGPSPTLCQIVPLILDACNLYLLTWKVGSRGGRKLARPN